MRSNAMKGIEKLICISFVLAFVNGCTYNYTRLTRDTVELARVENGNGDIDIYELKRSDGSGESTLVIRSERVRVRSDLGITLKEIDKELAQEKMLTPFKGLYVQEVSEGGPGAGAGVLPGDVLLRINGIDVMYMDRFKHILANNITPESEVEIVVLRGFEEKADVALKATTEAKKVTIPSTKAVKLNPPGIDGPAYAGIVTSTLPAEWTEKIYGENLPTVLVSGVAIGSPAYTAGIRSGDRILSVNGIHYESSTELKRWIMDHGPLDETACFEVYHKTGGSFQAEVALDDYEGSTDFNIPLVFDLNHDVYKTDWEIGLGLIFDYEGRYLKPDSRDLNYRREFSLVLGLIGYRWGPEISRTTLLWLIDFVSQK